MGIQTLGADACSTILEARGLFKHYGGVVALSDGNFDLQRNEVHAVLGDNGAGKSTMLKLLSGAIQPDGGTVAIDGQPVSFRTPQDARDRGISTVYQDLALVNHLDAAANMFLGREVVRRGPLSWFGILDRKAMRERAVAEVRRLKVGIRSVDQTVLGMSGGQRQCVAIARAVAFGTRIVIMDEPTAALGVRERGVVLDLIKEIRRLGMTVILISHSMPDVFDVADRVTILRLGRTVATLRTADTSVRDVVALITGAHAPGVAA